jgi:hypothetical protein
MAKTTDSLGTSTRCGKGGQTTVFYKEMNGMNLKRDADDGLLWSTRMGHI